MGTDMTSQIARSCSRRSSARPGAWVVSLLLLVLGGIPAVEAAGLLVNPPEHVSVELRPYVGEFQKVLVKHGFTLATSRAENQYELRLTYETSATAILVVTQLLRENQVVVDTPTRNHTFAKQGAIPDTVAVAAERFAVDVARYVQSAGLAPDPTVLADSAASDAVAASVADSAPTVDAALPPARTPVRSASEVKVYFHPPDAPYDEIGMLEASSKASWSFTDQGKVDKAVERLKKQAFERGANGLLLLGVGSEIAGTINNTNGRITTYGNTAYGSATGTSFAVTHKTASAIAIYVYPPRPPAASSPPAAAAGSPAPALAPAAGSLVTERVDGVYDALMKLDDLRKRGLISNEEFEAEKRKILAMP